MVEGYRATACIKELCDEQSMDAPILSQIHAILFDGKEPLSAIQALMGRGLRAE